MSAEEPIFHEVVGDAMFNKVPGCYFGTALDLLGLANRADKARVDDQVYRKIHHLRLLSFGPVYWPANPNTDLNILKGNIA